MNKLLATIQKEAIVLLRDRAGLLMIFAMPVILVTMMALIQDAPFRDFQEVKFQVLLVDEDRDSLGVMLRQSLQQVKNFELLEKADGQKLSRSEATRLVQSGQHKACIILPAKTTERFSSKTAHAVELLFVNFGLADATKTNNSDSAVQVLLHFDPATKPSFRTAVKNALEKLMAQAQSQLIVQSFSKQMQALGTEDKKMDVSFAGHLQVVEESAAGNAASVATNSVQHNVPAWTMYALFFILFPMAGNFIKEREDGSLLRLRLIAGSQFHIVAGKFAFYTFICLVQFAFMLCVGLYLLPLLGLPKLVPGNNYIALAAIALCVALAATSYGLFVAVFFKTHQQALAFGSVSVVLLAAIGGVWVPTYVMPEKLQLLSQFSPLAWGLNACNDLFLRNASLAQLAPNLARLFVFAVALLGISFFFYRRSDG